MRCSIIPIIRPMLAAAPRLRQSGVPIARSGEKSMTAARHIVVIGAGIVGAASAIELLRDGHHVTIVEPGEPGGEQAASYGNGGWLSPSSRGADLAARHVAQGARLARDPLGPLAIRWSYLPRCCPGSPAFCAPGRRVARVEATARALRPLVADAPARHRAPRRGSRGRRADRAPRPALCVSHPRRFRGRGARLAAAARQRRALDRTRCRRAAPARAGAGPALQFGVLVEEGGQLPRPRRLRRRPGGATRRRSAPRWCAPARPASASRPAGCAR